MCVCVNYVVAVTYVRRVVDYLASIGYGSLATLMGRYYAMDRDKRYERTKIAYEGLTKGVGEAVPVNQLIQVRSMGWITNYCIIYLNFYCFRKWRSGTTWRGVRDRLMNS